MTRWLATFIAAALATASVLLAVWGIWLIVAPAELIHFEVAIPALVLSVAGGVTAVVLWQRGST